MSYYNNRKNVDYQNLLGRTFVSITGAEKGSDIINFIDSEGKQYQMLHYQDCCEGVGVEDIEGDINDLLNSPLTQAEEVYNADGPEPEYADSYTWTFYKFATIKGYVTIRWLGESNGYYSESVDFEEVLSE